DTYPWLDAINIEGKAAVLWTLGDLSAPGRSDTPARCHAMISSSKLKSVDFYRKIPRDLTEASLSGAGLSIFAALAMVFLFGMELSSYLAVNTTTSVIVDRSSDGEFLRIDFNLSFPALSCEFASVDVSDVLGTNRLNITKTVRKFSIDRNLVPTGSEFHAGPIPTVNKHGDDVEEYHGDGSVALSSRNFDSYSHLYPVLVVNFYAPWCYWSNRLKPSWEKAAQIIRERYDPEMDGRILLGKVDCTEEVELCKRHHIQGYPSIRIFHKGSDMKENQGHHDHDSYYGERDTESLVAAMETYVANIPKEAHVLALEDKSNRTVDPAKRPAPMTGGCRIEGFVRVKKVPGSVVISARSGSHSFDPSQINVSHYVTTFSFGKRLSSKMFNELKRLFPYVGGHHDRLAGQSYIVKHGDVNANVTIEHYLQIVKTELVTLRYAKELKVLEEYEYTAHSSLVHSFYVPVVKFHFEPSPMQVLVTELPKSFSHFITNVCAIIGGVFTVGTSPYYYFHTISKSIEYTWLMFEPVNSRWPEYLTPSCTTR
uniref:Thioredoxin domain-containing protein n=1 Tax=Aegilops tauschii subsp. strangulata TaxID=200361 RepID=A0A453BDN3_AEGTS